MKIIRILSVIWVALVLLLSLMPCKNFLFTCYIYANRKNKYL